MSEQNKWEGWMIVELVGHRRLAGMVTEEVIAGKAMLRLDIPDRKGSIVTQYVNPDSVYALTPCDEKIARAFMASTGDPLEPYRWAITGPAGKHALYSDPEKELPY